MITFNKINYHNDLDIYIHLYIHSIIDIINNFQRNIIKKFNLDIWRKFKEIFEGKFEKA